MSVLIGSCSGSCPLFREASADPMTWPVIPAPPEAGAEEFTLPLTPKSDWNGILDPGCKPLRSNVGGAVGEGSNVSRCGEGVVGSILICIDEDAAERISTSASSAGSSGTLGYELGSPAAAEGPAKGVGEGEGGRPPLPR
jgi:hypothetical protein